jgi:hypothetical protein
MIYTKIIANKISQLGGGFGPGFKVAGGYDFVGNGSKSNSRNLLCFFVCGLEYRLML